MPLEVDAAYLNIRIGKDEREAWRHEADGRGVTLSDLVRDAVREKLAETSDTAEPPESQPARTGLGHLPMCACAFCEIQRMTESLRSSSG
jgi:hypothetical protein